MLRECEAQVLQVEGDRPDGEGWFTLDKTCFYPEGGGQPSDRGSYVVVSSSTGGESGTGEIFDVKKDESGVITHYYRGRTPVPGDLLRLYLDWDYCLGLRRYHTALHVLCGVIWREYGVKVTGAQLRSDGARMDFGFPEWRPELKDEIDAKVNAAIATGAAVKIYSLPADEARCIPDLIRTDIDLLPRELTRIRIVEIEGIDLQADGGSHVPTLADVGKVSIVKAKNKGAGFRRLEIEIG